MIWSEIIHCEESHGGKKIDLENKKQHQLMSQDYITPFTWKRRPFPLSWANSGAKKCSLLWGWHNHVDVQHVRPRLNLRTPKVALVGGSGFHKIIPNRRGRLWGMAGSTGDCRRLVSQSSRSCRKATHLLANAFSLESIPCPHLS